MALGVVSPEPPLGAGLVVVVVLDLAAVFLAGLEPLLIQKAMPKMTPATITREMTRRMFCLRLADFFWASSRALRPAFWR